VSDADRRWGGAGGIAGGGVIGCTRLGRLACFALLDAESLLRLCGVVVVVQFEVCHSAARYYRARNLLFHNWQEADSSADKAGVGMTKQLGFA
jgi:hypothetical protein